MKVDKLLLATTNPGKVREIRGILRGAPQRLRPERGAKPPSERERGWGTASIEIDILTLDSLPRIEEPNETGLTFAENARLKALYYNQATGLPSAADDSGLEIAALDGAPGIHSARWEGTDYQVKFRRIYELLRERGADRSPARFVCAVALAVDGRIEYEAEGIVEGEIAPTPRGSNGFGYDPIFFYPPLGCTLGEVPDEVKATLSHRGAAFRRLRGYLIEADPTFVANGPSKPP